MTHQKGFATIVAFIIIGIIVLGGVGYVAMKPNVGQQANVNVQSDTRTDDSHTQTAPGDHPEVDHDANEGVNARVDANAKISIAWRFTDAGEVNATPQTKVTALINGKPYEMGTFTGSCSEIGATGGVDGKGLLAGELAAAQCWFAGGGNEIGVFASEDGGVEMMVGEIGEGEEGAGVFRGNFDIKNTVKF